jgi:hypothetical protein
VETIELMNKEAERILEKGHQAWEEAGKPAAEYPFGHGTFPDEWQGVRPHEETIYVRVA